MHNSKNNISAQDDLKEREAYILKKRAESIKKVNEINRKRQKHNVFSFILVTVLATALIALFPNTPMIISVIAFLCIFFSISISNQIQINRVILVIVPLALISIFLHYFLT